MTEQAKQRFKVGDHVTCIDEGPGTMVKVGHPYVVTKVENNGIITIEWESGEVGDFSSGRFVLAHDYSSGAEEYEEIMAGEEVWASIRKNSEN